ncbi:MAG: PEP-utilizing enzyme [Nanoarchaeota archaeon]|nr:hypothetical protein [Nanoarchaeota archaeon]MBU1030784.1 hypothetical protein [Nanoarchaeota archaeon]MBU1849976.1 hypothetical protein [Nanoarchaeota archaeon]
MTLDEAIEKIRHYMRNEDRKDEEFRYLITTTELGDIGKYLTHDPKLNSGARPHGSKQDEILAYGQALVQLIALADLRGIKVTEALNSGLLNWADSDWRKIKAKSETEVKGITGCPGQISGIAYVVGEKHPLKKVAKESILVTAYAKPELASYLGIIAGFVTDHGGYTCHAANIARDKGIPCIVGTGNATKLIKHGEQIILDANINGFGKVIKEYNSEEK